MSTKNSNSNHVILAVAGGFYFFGEQVSAPDGYIALRSGAMSGGFSGGRGIAGVATAHKGSSIKLDIFDKDRDLIFPVTAVYAIMPCVDLYSVKSTEIRNK